MSLTLYDLMVPTIQRAFEQLINILKEGEKWAEENNVDKQKLTEGKLAEDMLPLTFQIQAACNSVKNALSRIGGKGDLPRVEDNEKTFPELYARIEHTLSLLKDAESDKFKKLDEKVLVKIGTSTELNFNAEGYVQKFVLPNFYFHHTAAYLILRHLGVPVGKWLYLGRETIQDY